MAHKVFFAFLLVLSLTAAIAAGVRGVGFYLTPVHERPFRSDYGELKPTGVYSHGLGVFGASLIIVGVATYSTRKRLRALWELGKLSRWLEFHIALCLLGPTLVVYHTTFKAGGVAAISLWTMLSVVASGVIGRFLYAQIPRNIKGAELSVSQIEGEIGRLGSVLAANKVGAVVLRSLDAEFSEIRRNIKSAGMVATYFKLQVAKRRAAKSVRALIAAAGMPREEAGPLLHAAATRASLIQKSAALAYMEKIFFYWHAIHLPFTVIMFITLAAHVTVEVLLGYKWLF